MAEIICIECKATVSDSLGYCPECGYPFENKVINSSDASVDPNDVPHSTVSVPLETILLSLESVGLEVKELKNGLDEIKHDLNSNLSSSSDNIRNMLAVIVGKLEAMESVQNAMKAQAEADKSDKTKKKWLDAFYKMLNSPNSMFDYMFYICLILLVFVVINLFLVAYVVTIIKQ